MRKMIVGVLSAIAGIVLAVAIHCSFMIVEIDGSEMLPTIEPGQKAVVFLLSETEDMRKGDVIAYYPSFYTVNSGDGPLVRRIKGKNAESCVVASDATLTTDNTDIVENKDILGKVILYG